MAARSEQRARPDGSSAHLQASQTALAGDSSLGSTVSGRITVTGSDRGVRGLIVEAYHVVGQATADRLGSATTRGDGSFSIALPPAIAASGSASGRRSRPAWDLQLTVLVPEREGVGRERRMLFTTEVRPQAALREEFLIEVPERRLRALKVPESAAATPGEALAASVRAASARAEEIRKVTDRVLEERLEAVAERRSVLRDGIRPRLRDELSAVSAQERASGRFVPTDGDIRRVHLEAITNDVKALVAKTGEPSSGSRMPVFTRRSRIALSAAQHVALLGNVQTPTFFSEADVERALGSSVDKPAAISRRGLVIDPCRPQSKGERCLEDAGGGTSGASETDSGSRPADGSAAPDNGSQPGSNVTFDKQTFIAKLMSRQTSPEDPVEFGAEDGKLEEPLTAGGVSDVIKGLVFSPGPADVPAFYDFHDIQMAFEPVWQEALDGKYLEDVESVYERTVESGGMPAVTLIHGILGAPVNEPAPSNFLDKLLDAISDAAAATDTAVPASVASAVFISLEEWRALPRALQIELQSLTDEISRLRDLVRRALDPDQLPDVNIRGIADLIRAAYTTSVIAYRSQIQLLTSDASRLVAHARRLLLEREARGPFAPTNDIIERLRRQRSRAYPFRYFAASPSFRSVNFGVMVTYRQQWVPVSYQVGELVSTIPLAPKEIRKFSKRTVIKTKRAQQEIESNLVSRKDESEERSRAEAEIVSRAAAKTNFLLSVSGTMNIGGEGPIGGNITSESTFTRDAEQHSESVKKEFREAVIKSAEEYKNERKVEVSTEETLESEVTESGEIQNPNDEIPVTFLFYELQRRFKVSEKLHRLQSVVFVAQEMPSSGSIDAAWLIRHDWILNRVLLDDSFRAALTYVSTTLVSEEAVLREMREALFRQRKLVEELKEDVAERRVLEGLRYAALQRQIEQTAKSSDSDGGLLGEIVDVVSSVSVVGALVEGGIDLLTGGGSGPSEAAQIREGASRDAYERERRAEEDLASRLMNAVSTLESMQRAYSERLGQHLRQLTQVERLATHVTQNIMHYMQAIWGYEPDDQRFLRLRNVPVPIFRKDKTIPCMLIDPHAAVTPNDRPPISGSVVGVLVDPGAIKPPHQPEDIETKPLSEVADINRPLGFIGNYMIFPMNEANPITEFMMDPYVTLAEGQYGVSDPDPLGNVTLEEFGDYICCLREYCAQQQGTTMTPIEATAPLQDRWAEIKPQLRDALERLLQLSLRSNDEVIVPTNSLYIEALPGAHSVVEKFKHLHRQIDVKAAQETLRRSGIDNIRRAQRILDSDLEDPDIDAKYLFEGGGSATVLTPPPPAGAGGGGGVSGGGG